jgi:hypothetical protein
MCNFTLDMFFKSLYLLVEKMFSYFWFFHAVRRHLIFNRQHTIAQPETYGNLAVICTYV